MYQLPSPLPRPQTHEKTVGFITQLPVFWWVPCLTALGPARAGAPPGSFPPGVGSPPPTAQSPGPRRRPGESGREKQPGRSSPAPRPQPAAPRSRASPCGCEAEAGPLAGLRAPLAARSLSQGARGGTRSASWHALHGTRRGPSRSYCQSWEASGPRVHPSRGALGKGTPSCSHPFGGTEPSTPLPWPLRSLACGQQRI